MNRKYLALLGVAIILVLLVFFIGPNSLFPKGTTLSTQGPSPQNPTGGESATTGTKGILCTMNTEVTVIATQSKISHVDIIKLSPSVQKIRVDSTSDPHDINLQNNFPPKSTIFDGLISHYKTGDGAWTTHQSSTPFSVSIGYVLSIKIPQYYNLSMSELQNKLEESMEALITTREATGEQIEARVSCAEVDPFPAGVFQPTP